MSIVTIDPDSDYLALVCGGGGAGDDKVMDEFMANVNQTKDVVRAAQKERGAKAGELVVRATFEHFWVKNPEGSGNVESFVPHPVGSDMRKKKDNSGATFPGGIPMQAVIEEFPVLLPGACEKIEGRPGWKIKWSLSYLPASEAFLLSRETGPDGKQRIVPSKNTLAAWTPVGPNGELPQDDLSMRIRELCSADGTLVTEKYTEVQAGQSGKFKAPDTSDTILRATLPGGGQRVQPDSGLLFNRVEPTGYVIFDSEEEAKNRAAANNKNKAGQGGVPDLPPTTATPQPLTVNAQTGAIVLANGAPVQSKKQETRLYVQYTYECRGSVLLREDKEAVDLCHSERQHRRKNKDAHQLVHIEQIRARVAEPHKSYYWYVLPKYMTKWSPEHPEWLNDDQGITLIRESPQERDFVQRPAKEGGPTFYGLKVTLMVFQWLQRPNTRERYVVTMGLARENDSVWRSFGITNGEAYAALMLNNPDLPFHVTATYWRKASVERPANDPKEINKKEGTENIRGYHDFIISEVVPDYLRYLRARGLRVSPDYVKDEFFDWVNYRGREKTLTLELNPWPAKSHNPLHALQGSASAVISLGNGQPGTDPQMPKAHGANHGFQGDITPFINNGTHEFFVMTSRTLSDEERARYCGQSAPEFADMWIKERIKNAADAGTRFYYWIFAVNKSAKYAKPRAPVQVPAVTSTPALPAPTPKREREEVTVDQRPEKVAAVANDGGDADDEYEEEVE